MARQAYDQKTVSILLLGGVTKPHDKSAAARRSRAQVGNYLEGVSHDLANVESFVTRSKTFELHNNFQNKRNGTTEDVKREITCLLKENSDPDVPIAIYYSGHGSSVGGEWCFKDANFGWKDLVFLIMVRGNIKIFCDSCFSGDWAKKLESLEGRTKNVEIFAGSHPGAAAMDAGNRGGMATNKWLVLWPKIFDEIDKVRYSKKAYNELAKALMDSYGCMGKINSDGSYSYCEFRDADAEWQQEKKQKELEMGIKALKLHGGMFKLPKYAEDEEDEDDSKQSSAAVCSKGHPLRWMSHSQLVHENRGYARGVGCDKCNAHGIGSALSAHCSICTYDLCPMCVDKSAKRRGPSWIGHSSFTVAKAKKTCDKGHQLLKLSIAELRVYSHYQSGHYICDGCFASSARKGYGHSYHCPACRFDLCPKCFSR